MKEYNHFNFEEFRLNLDKMKLHKIEDEELLKEEISNNMKKNEEHFKNKKVEYDFDSYIGPSPSNLESYYSFWRIQLLCSIDEEVLNRIMENGFNINEILNELGITKDELFKPNPSVIKKAKKYMLESKDVLAK